jgi:hypothetical protein
VQGSGSATPRQGKLEVSVALASDADASRGFFADPDQSSYCKRVQVPIQPVPTPPGDGTTQQF